MLVIRIFHYAIMDKKKDVHPSWKNNPTFMNVDVLS